MPLYEFRCKECRQMFEKIVFSSDKEPVKCPKCGAGKPERLLSIFSAGTGYGRADSSLSSSCGPTSGGFS